MARPLAPVLAPNPHVASSEMLCPPSLIVPEQFPSVFPDKALLLSVSIPSLATAPPSLFENVLLITIAAAAAVEAMAPPVAAPLSAKVLLVTVSVPLLKMPPPWLALLLSNVLLVTTRVPLLEMPPPLPGELPCATVRSFNLSVALELTKNT